MEKRNEVNICPYHVWYENGKVFADCYVINGFDHAVFNINVPDMTLSTNTDGLFAKTSFSGIYYGRAIPARSFIRWTFSFPGNSVLKANAKLTGGLRCIFDVCYLH